MNLLVLSDLHLEQAPFEPPPGLDFDVVVLAGDIVSPGPACAAWLQDNAALRRARAVLLVPGNHEYFDAVLQDQAHAMRDALAQVQQPPARVLDGDSCVIDGVRFIGFTLWTDFLLRIDTPDGPVCDPVQGIAAARRSMADYRTIQWRDEAGAIRPLQPYDTIELHRAQRSALAALLQQPFDGPTVVITHHGPHRDSLAPRHAERWVSTAFINELPADFFKVPVLWIHGHTHTSFDYRIGGCRVVCNPRGYRAGAAGEPENPNFNPGLVLRVEQP